MSRSWLIISVLIGLPGLSWALNPEAAASVRIQNKVPTIRVDAGQLHGVEALMGPGWDIQVDRTAGSIRTIAGGRLQPFGSSAEESARLFLDRYLRVMGAKPGAGDAKFLRTVRSPVGYHVRYAQQVAGVPVLDGGVTVHLDSEFGVRMVSSDWKTGARAPGNPQLTAEKALQVAEKAIGLSRTRGTPEAQLFVTVDGSGSRPVYRVDVPAAAPLGDWRVLVDAHDGAVLAKENLLQHSEAKGRVFDPNPCVTLKNATIKDQSDSAAAVTAEAYKDVTLLGLDGSGKLKGQFVDLTKSTPAAEETSGVFNYDRSDKRFEQVMIYYHIDRAQRYIQSLGFQNVQNRTQVCNAHGTTEDNSWYSPMTKELTFGDGGVDDAEDADVIMHEYGHSIQDNQVPGFGGSGEGGAMGEGFGDYLAASVRSDSGFNPLAVAIWDATAYSNANPPALRRLDSTKHYPENVQHEVHADGEIWSACLRQVWDVLGSHDADKLVLTSHFFLQPRATFADGAAALLQADRQLYGGSHVKAIKKIFVDRGIIKVQGKLQISLKDAAGRPKDGVVTISGVAQPLPVPATGVAETALAPGDYKLAVTSFGSVPQQNIPATVKEDETTAVNIVLAAAPSVNLTGKVTRKTGGEPVANARVTIAPGPIQSVLTGPDGRYQLTAPAGKYTLTIAALGLKAFVKPDLTLSGDTTVDAALDSLPPVLIVNKDDASHGKYYADAFTAAGAASDTWTVKTNGAVTSELLMGYQVVVWTTGEKASSTISTAEQAMLKAYLASGGNLLVSGEDVGYDIKNSAFYKEVLGAKWIADTAKAKDIEGSGLAFTLGGGDGADDQRSPDVIQPAESATGVEAFLQYKGGEGAAGLKVQLAKGRVVYLGFGVEGISTKAGREALVAYIWGWVKPSLKQVVARAASFHRGIPGVDADRAAAFDQAYAEYLVDWARTLPAAERSQVERLVQSGGASRSVRASMGNRDGDR